MPLKKGFSRDREGQFRTPLEEMIAPDHEVRFIDAFVESLDLVKLGFSRTEVKQYGSGSYGAGRLLKLYIYGYLNRIRSSRQLARECERNIEVWWLLEELKPSYHTIADFRKETPKALRATFRQYSLLLKRWELYGGETLAVDGSKFRAQNSQKNNYNQAKLDRHQQYIDNKIESYLQELSDLDEVEDEDSFRDQRQNKLLAAVQEQLDRRRDYADLEAQLVTSGERQLSTTAPDARALPLHRNIVEVGYNVQSAVDAEHNLVVAYESTKERDDQALYPMATAANEILASERLAVLADKGYHTGEQLAACEEDPILETYVAPVSSKSGTAGFRKADFRYDAEQDVYTCPIGETLTPNGRWYRKNTGYNRRSYGFRRFALPDHVCRACPNAQVCNPGGLRSRHGRYVERGEYDDAIDANAWRVATHTDLYRRRQAIVEHPFGTIKRSWGYTYFLLKSLDKVDGEAALFFLAYNLRRSMSILGVTELIRRLPAAIFRFFRLSRQERRSRWHFRAPAQWCTRWRTSTKWNILELAVR
jgi:transposase